MAWLAATPKPPAGSKRATNADQAPKLSRSDQMKKSGIDPKMPPNPAPHITARLIEIGLAGTNGVGLTPISWQEINEWQRACAVRLPPWEARLIRQLSVAYIGETKRAESENCPAPWHTQVTRREIETEDMRLRAVLG